MFLYNNFFKNIKKNILENDCLIAQVDQNFHIRIK